MSNNIKKNHNIQELLARIREHPATFIGSLSVSNLKAFLDGYYSARWETKQAPGNFEGMYEFTEMLQDRFQMDAAAGWHGTLLLVAGGESEGLELFWELWDEYLAIHMAKSGV